MSTPALLSLRYICSFSPFFLSLTLPVFENVAIQLCHTYPLLLRGSCEALKAPINVLVFCKRKSKQLQLSLSLLSSPTVGSYYIKPSPLNIHVLQSEQSVQATVQPHIDDCSCNPTLSLKFPRALFGRLKRVPCHHYARNPFPIGQSTGGQWALVALLYSS